MELSTIISALDHSLSSTKYGGFHNKSRLPSNCWSRDNHIRCINGHLVVAFFIRVHRKWDRLDEIIVVPKQGRSFSAHHQKAFKVWRTTHLKVYSNESNRTIWARSNNRPGIKFGQFWRDLTLGVKSTPAPGSNIRRNTPSRPTSDKLLWQFWTFWILFSEKPYLYCHRWSCS